MKSKILNAFKIAADWKFWSQKVQSFLMYFWFWFTRYLRRYDKRGRVSGYVRSFYYFQKSTFLVRVGT